MYTHIPAVTWQSNELYTRCVPALCTATFLESVSLVEQAQTRLLQNNTC